MHHDKLPGDVGWLKPPFFPNLCFFTFSPNVELGKCENLGMSGAWGEPELIPGEAQMNSTEQEDKDAPRNRIHMV